MFVVCLFPASMALTQRPGKVELGPRGLYGEEGIGESGKEGGVAYKVLVHVVANGQSASHQQEEEHAAAADQQLAADGLLQGRRHVSQCWKCRDIHLCRSSETRQTRISCEFKSGCLDSTACALDAGLQYLHLYLSNI